MTDCSTQSLNSCPQVLASFALELQAQMTRIFCKFTNVLYLPLNKLDFQNVISYYADRKVHQF